MPDARAWLIAAMLVCACGTTSEPAPAAKPAPREQPSQPPAPSVTQPSEPAPEPAVKVELYVANPEGFGDPCTDDAGCGWDNPCAATRCVGAAHAPEVDCLERTPEPGQCSCVAGHCSLRPTEVPAQAPSCRLEPCGLDQGAGVCVAGSMVEANRYTRDVGPACHCEQDSLECRFVWVEPIACAGVEDCWVSESRPHHPIARPKAQRGAKFRPCEDGEVAPICKDGLCSLAAYKC